MSITITRSVESASYRKLFATAMSRLPGIGEDALKLEMANAMQEFTRKTHCWREMVSMNVIAGQPTYQITPQSNCADITYVIALEVSGLPYSPLGAEAFPENKTRAYKVLDSFEEVTLYPTPTQSAPKALKVWVGLTLEPESLDLPDELIDHFFEQILDGILERAYSHSTKPYTDKDKAMYHHRRFLAAITRTRREIRGGKSQASPPWRFPTQAPGGTRRGARSYGW
jgi:hypothetical protein